MLYILFLQTIREASSGVLNPFMLKITVLGESLITYLLLAGIYWCVNKRTGQLMAWNVAIGCWLNQWSKKLFRIERPWVRNEQIVPVSEAVAGAGGYSMPSGHTSRTVATWGSAGYSSWRESKKEKQGKWIGVLLWIIAALIMFSRNYLGVHTLEDVLIALAAGIVIIFISDILLNWVDKRGKNRDIIVAIIACVIIFLPMLRYGCLSNVGASFGFIIGWLLERRLLSYEVKGSAAERVVKFIPGAIVVFLLLTSGAGILSHIIPSKYAGFFMQGAVSFFIIFLYPMFIQIWEKKKYRVQLAAIIAVVVCVVLAAGGVRIVRNIHNANSAQGVSETETTVQETVPDVTEAPTVPVVDDTEAVTVKIIAHRGYSGVAPENTLDAFAKAADIGADMIELDVQMTADGQLVVFHDSDLLRVTGVEGQVATSTYEQLQSLDAGKGERIPTLAEVLELVKSTDMGIYLELKDVGERAGFVDAVIEEVKVHEMQQRVVYASFNYGYLQQIKASDESALILCNTSLGDADRLLNEYPADCYGLNVDMINQDTIRKLKEAGKTVYVWTVNTPMKMRNVITLGADGIVTNEPGMARVVVHDEYRFLTDNYISSFIVPALYDNSLQEPYANNYIMQGLTKAGNVIFISAYDYVADGNSILYVMNTEGSLLNIVDLGFRAHTGGIAYDEAHDLIWVTGAEGTVKAISKSAVCNGAYQGADSDILVSFDAELVNHNGSKVASFLTIDNGRLYVGSYVNGYNGRLKYYDISEPTSPKLEGEVEIPERIQGITFAYRADGMRTMLLSQGYQMDDAALLCFTWQDGQAVYSEPEESYILPEGVEQIQMTTSGMYMLFESAVRPYRATCRVPNDRVWVVDYQR